MPAIHAPPKRRPFHQQAMHGLGNLSTDLRRLGMAAAKRGESRPERIRSREEIEEELMARSQRIDLSTVEGAEQMLMLGLKSGSKDTVRKALLSVIGWKDPAKAREFFKKFFEDPENEQMKEIGRNVYARYVNLGGEKLW